MEYWPTNVFLYTHEVYIFLFILRRIYLGAHIFPVQNLLERFDVLLGGRVVSAHDLTSTDLPSAPIAMVWNGKTVDDMVKFAS